MHWFFTESARFFSMGGYAWYVWPAYTFAFVGLAASVYMPYRTQKQILKKILRERELAEEGDVQ